MSFISISGRKRSKENETIDSSLIFQNETDSINDSSCTYVLPTESGQLNIFEVTEVTNTNEPKNPFAQLISLQSLLTAIENCKFKEPTEIRKKVIPLISAEQDIVVCAPPGTGKTSAYILAILQTMINMKDNIPVNMGNTVQAPTCIVIAPSKESAMQIHGESVKFAKGSHIVPQLIYGRSQSQYEEMQIRRGCQFLVITPQRLFELIDNIILLNNLKFLIFDLNNEAGFMFDYGFLYGLRMMMSHWSIISKSKRQTLIFSYSSTEAIHSLAKEFLKSDFVPVSYDVSAKNNQLQCIVCTKVDANVCMHYGRLTCWNCSSFFKQTVQSILLYSI